MIIKAAGPDSPGPFLGAVDGDDTRCALHDLCDYDAFKDGFLLNPTLQSMSVLQISRINSQSDPIVFRSATLPGEEDVAGLSAILDPNTVTGRVARISLLTSGSAGDTLSLAFSGERHTKESEDSNITNVPSPSHSVST